MPKSDMPKPRTYTHEDARAYFTSLMILIFGRGPRKGERDWWLGEICKITKMYSEDGQGIGFSSLSAAYRGQPSSKNQYVSKPTRELLEKAAANAREADGFIPIVQKQIDIWRTAPKLFGRHIEEACNFIDALREYDAENVRQDAAQREMAVRLDDDAADTAAASSASSSPAAACRRLKPA